MAKIEKRPKGWLVGKQQIEDWLIITNRQLMDKNSGGAIRTCQRILRYIPKTDKKVAEALGLMASAYALQNEFEKAYQLFTDALEIDPQDAYLWFNRGLSARFTSRAGQSLRDLEKAVSLEGNGKMAAQFKDAVKFGQQLVDSELSLRGKDFTLEQLIEQQELFQQGNTLSAQGKWQDAEMCFRNSIAMGDCLPQPWGNLGICLAMQNRFDEAEAAYHQSLKVDPKYDRANQHLENLAYRRNHPDETPAFKITSPFDDIEADITFVK